jgi:Protein of unknown function (DUF1553)/Protein of unknown function (DUF1549)/Concanavalin A-like lectin/glucanases superfamily/Planctomycete cytochrome C
MRIVPVAWTGRSLLAALGVTVLALTPAGARGGDVRFNRDVRPILAENCFPCHGPDSAARKADLRLDRRDDALQAEVFVPGKPDESELVARIFAADAGKVMPPPKSRKKLTAAQRETLKRWIAAGAEYEPHWSLIAPTRPDLPAVKDPMWVRNPIDAFVDAKRQAVGLTPAPEADRRTLARRASFDLTGLPPEPADVEAFVNDPAPDAYEKYVDRVLASPAWGEHRGRYWLDAARYADTHGIHFDNFREMWSYRDWVIGAFNRNLPFDRFTVEQLAGDLLPGRTLEQQVASGFNRCNITTNEGGVIPEEYLVLYTRDRTETTAQVFMGLTAGCAVCHDHKFDPLSQKEFYSLAAFFNNTTQGAMDGNVKDTPPVVVVPRPEDRRRWDALTGEAADERRRADARKKEVRPEFDRWLTSATPGRVAADVPHDGLRFHALLAEGAGSQVTVVEDGQARTLTLAKPPAWQPGHVAAQAFKSTAAVTVEVETAGDFEKDQPFAVAAWVKVPRAGLSGPIVARMDEGNGFRGWDLWLEAGRPGAHVVHKWPEDAVKVVADAPLTANQWHHVLMTYDGSGKAAGVTIYVDGKRQSVKPQADSLAGSVRTEVPFQVARRRGPTKLDNIGVHDVRIYGRALAPTEAARLAGSTRAAYLVTKSPRSPAETDELFAGWLAVHDGPSRDFAESLAKLDQERAALQARGTVAHVMQEKNEAAMAFILYRGEYDKRRDPVKAEVPAALPPFPPDLPKTRLGLAQWLLRPEHPLTARVTVNRFWQEVFGTGIVRTAGDFGISGELPSHPELLDWLAVEFRESGWDVKRFFRLLVTSATYRQSAVATPDKLAKDPQNTYLSRGPRFRLDGEAIRDSALAASGLLARKLGGPSVRPYQPEGVWEAVAMIGSNTRDYKRDTGEGLYRRGLYTFWKRAAPPAMFEIFNAPTRETCAVRRERTNTPLQALVTLNDVQFVEASRALAERALKEAGDTDGRLDVIARRLLARPLRPEERAVVRRTLDDLLAFYKDHGEEARKLIAVGDSKADPALAPAELAAWSVLANQVMNLDEVLNK